ncbi:hypothetical protein OG298_38350 [Streptomyces sp. NBC_01005]|uniref:hypothetical protein n=1 Tax=unclassified Streptomyces TaxID=2593676 RepID=UPI002E32EB98|nr:hypothetical protein [Streptomyces sp. NBC_01362]WSW09764.1 hypothetical protein OG298_38350 [Streptomyces sp. NBC_01005]WTC99273.1 hypothetical protein OH736_38365 [Streptomyces sp. NBC_01650]
MLERGALTGCALDLLRDAVHVVGDHSFEVGREHLTVPVPAPGHQVDDDYESFVPDPFEGVDLFQGGDRDSVGDVLRRDNALEGIIADPAPAMGVPKDLFEGVEGVLLGG